MMKTTKPFAPNRREFVAAVAATAAALATGACRDSATDTEVPPNSSGTGASGGGAPGPGDPVWTMVPPIQFTEGVAASVSIATFVSDPNGDPLTITKNDMALPPGVTYDATGQRFVYDGIGAAAYTDGHVLSADDGDA